MAYNAEADYQGYITDVWDYIDLDEEIDSILGEDDENEYFEEDYFEDDCFGLDEDDIWEV